MKKTISLVLLALCISAVSFAQQQKDSIPAKPVDSVAAPAMVVIMLTEDEYRKLLKDLELMDERPSVIKTKQDDLGKKAQYLNQLFANYQMALLNNGWIAPKVPATKK